MDQGLPSFYITISLVDVFNLLVKFLTGSDIDIDNLLPEQVPDYWEQSYLVARNPAVAAKFFNIYMKAFLSAIRGYNADKMMMMAYWVMSKHTMDVLRHREDKLFTAI